MHDYIVNPVLNTEILLRNPSVKFVVLLCVFCVTICCVLFYELLMDLITRELTRKSCF